MKQLITNIKGEKMNFNYYFQNILQKIYNLIQMNFQQNISKIFLDYMEYLMILQPIEDLDILLNST